MEWWMLAWLASVLGAFLLGRQMGASLVIAEMNRRTLADLMTLGADPVGDEHKKWLDDQDRSKLRSWMGP